MTADRSTPRSGGLGAMVPAAEPSRAAGRLQRPRGARTGETRVVLATSDAVFAALCQRALEGSNLLLVAAVSPAELVDTVRRLAPGLVVLDADGEDQVAVLEALATKVMLVCDARIVVASAYLAPGAPGLCGLLAAIAASFVQKARGASWFGLAEEDRAWFSAALRAACDADHGEVFVAPPSGGPESATAVDRARDRGARARADLDTGWEAGAEQPAPPTRSRP